jgi:glycosyltransferase involved in cell wall biosynthesis
MNATAEKQGFRSQVNEDALVSSSDRLRIAICPPELQPLRQMLRGEPTNATYIIQGYIARGLPARGHNLTFVVPANLRDTVYGCDIKQLKVAPRTWSNSGWFNMASKVTWQMQRWLGVPYLNYFSNYRLYDACLQCLPGHDVVYERNGIYKVGVAMACKRLKLPYVLYFEADDIQEYDIMGEPLTGLLRWRAGQAIRYNLDAADCVICVSEPLKAHLTTAWQVPAEKIVVFPNVADVQRFRPAAETRAEVRTVLGLAANPLLIFVGNFYEWHDVTTLLAAFAQTLAAYPEARLILVGDGSRRQAMMQYATELGLDHAVQFTGLIPHDEVPRYLAAADLAVVPYPPLQTDLWLSPLKLFEYMASGLAVIASAVGQLPDVIQEGRNGLLVPPGDVPATAAAMQRLLDEPNLRSQLGRQARQDAVEKHSWEHYLSRLEQIFAAVIAGHPVHSI